MKSLLTFQQRSDRSIGIWDVRIVTWDLDYAA